jgi:hypothetical protein
MSDGGLIASERPLKVQSKTNGRGYRQESADMAVA